MCSTFFTLNNVNRTTFNLPPRAPPINALVLKKLNKGEEDIIGGLFTSLISIWQDV